MKQIQWKRIGCLLLAIVLVAGYIPVTARASEDVTEPVSQNDGYCTGVDSGAHVFDPATLMCECGVTAVASTVIGGNTVYHATLAEAISAVSTAVESDNAVLTLLEDVQLSSTLSFGAGVFTLDLNHKQIAATNNNVYVSFKGGRVEIINANILCNVSMGNADVTLTSGTIQATGDTVSVGLDGTFTVAGGKICGGSKGVDTVNDGSLIVTGGEISGSSYGVYATNGELTVSGGVIRGGSYGIYRFGGGDNTDTVITGGTICGSAYGVYATHTTWSSGHDDAVIMSGGSIIADGTDGKGIYVYGGVDVFVSGGSISGAASDIYLADTCNVQLSVAEGSKVGPCFPDGITVSATSYAGKSYKLNTILAEGASYWAKEGEEYVKLTVDDKASQITDKGTVYVCANDVDVTYYRVHVSGIQVTSKNAADVLGDGTVSYDAQTKTLTLDGAYIEAATVGGSTVVYGIYSPESLNIVVGSKGAQIVGGSYGIESYGDITITGGQLTVLDAYSIGIYANQHDLTINNCDVTVRMKNDGSHALCTGGVSGKITINNSNLELHGGNTGTDGQYGLATLEAILGNNVHLIATGGTQASYVTPTLASGVSCKTRTAPDAEFVDGIVYNGENYFEFISNSTIHSYGELIEATDAVHTKDELKGAVAAHYLCADCQKYFDADKNETTLEALTGEAPTHSFDEWVNTDASEHWKVCACGKTSEKSSHNYVDGKCECDHVCTHQLGENNTCSSCGAMLTAKVVDANGDTSYVTVSVALVMETAENGTTVYALADCEDGFSIPETITFCGGDYTIAGRVYNYGTIENGTFTKSLGNMGSIKNGTFKESIVTYNGSYIYDGTFEGKIDNNGAIKNGTFKGVVENRKYIYGGTFQEEVTNVNGSIEGGTFSAMVTNQSIIRGGTFKGGVVNNSATYNGISRGTFECEVTNNGHIEGGTYKMAVINNSWIEGGTFEGTVSNNGDSEDYCRIDGGTFNGTVVNKKTIRGGTFNGEVENLAYIQGGTFNGKLINKTGGTVTNHCDTSKYTYGENFVYDQTEGGSVTGSHKYTDSTCDICKYVCEHPGYENGSCTDCGAAGLKTSGKCGENLYWSYDGEGTITITGTGDMYHYENHPNSVGEDQPWEAYEDDITTVIVEEGATSIGYGAFNNCDKLKDVSLPETLTKINAHGFSFCDSLEEIRLPDGLKIIDGYAFSRSGLKSIHLGPAVEKIYANAFTHNKSQTQITVAEENPYFCAVDNVLFTKDMKKLVCYPGGLTQDTYEVPEGVTTIAEEGFSQNEWIKRVVLPDTVTVMETDAFFGCWALSQINLPSGLKRIESATFNHTALENVVVPASVQYIGHLAFASIDEMKSIVFEGDAPKFDSGAFGSSYPTKATAYYPGDNDTWTDDKLQNYGGEITWIPYCIGEHIYEQGLCVNCGDQYLIITAEPEDVEQEVGKKFRISVEARGEGLTYQWYVKEAGAKAFKVSSNKTSAYAYTMQHYMNGRQVYCVVTDKYGNEAISETATITRAPMAVEITKQPSDVYVGMGETFSVKVKAEGDGLTYQWFYKNAGAKKFAVSSVKKASYSSKMVSYMVERQVYCVITDKYGNEAISDVATIYLPAKTVEIVTQPEDAYAAMGQRFTISTEVEGNGLTYQWYYKNPGMKEFAASSNKTSAYSYTMANYMIDRQVYCVITDQNGDQVTTDIATIHISE